MLLMYLSYFLKCCQKIVTNVTGKTKEHHAICTVVYLVDEPQCFTFLFLFTWTVNNRNSSQYNIG